jgi:hypothetical protein
MFLPNSSGFDGGGMRKNTFPTLFINYGAVAYIMAVMIVGGEAGFQ